MKASGIVLWAGPSLLDGAPIVVIATGLADASANPKTGDMVQTWIMRQDRAPHVATQDGTDASVCGDCQHRPANGGACYVMVWRGPRSVWQAWTRGRYPTAEGLDAVADVGAGRMVRLGSYGDPAAVPAEVWQALVSRAKGHTGYTHQWRLPHADALRGLCMASADSSGERDEAQADGWRTFRVRTADQPLGPREVVCPASEEAGRKLDCAACRACGGADGRKGSVAIVVHGARARKFAA